MLSKSQPSLAGQMPGGQTAFMWKGSGARCQIGPGFIVFLKRPQGTGVSKKQTKKRLMVLLSCGDEDEAERLLGAKPC